MKKHTEAEKQVAAFRAKFVKGEEPDDYWSEMDLSCFVDDWLRQALAEAEERGRRRATNASGVTKMRELEDNN